MSPELARQTSQLFATASCRAWQDPSSVLDVPYREATYTRVARITTPTTTAQLSPRPPVGAQPPRRRPVRLDAPSSIDRLDRQRQVISSLSPRAPGPCR